jgi:hypothetical protein
MADKEIHHVSDSGGGSWLAAGIVIAALALFGLFFISDGFNFGGNKDINVNIEPPKIDRPAGGAG